MAYLGYPNWNAWNVSLWINNDEGLYREAVRLTRRHNRQKAAQAMLEFLNECGITHTPDGARYSVTSIRKAMVGI